LIDISDLSFSEDEDDGAEIGWSRDVSPVNVVAFISAIGATSTVPEDGTVKDFFCLFVPKNCSKILLKKWTTMRDCIARKADTKWYEMNMAEMQAFFGLHMFLPETSPRCSICKACHDQGQI